LENKVDFERVKEINSRSLIAFSLLILGISMALGQSAAAQTRLGLHVTQEELNIWRQRMNDNVNGINGYSYQAIYQNRILSDANAFKNQSHPGGDGFWSGGPSSRCFAVDAGDPRPARNAGRKLAKSSFVFLLTGDTSYADPVKTELLNQIAQAGTVWLNRTTWCPYNGTADKGGVYDNDAFQVVPWLMNLLFAYDYLKAGGYTGFTAQQKTNIETWFHNAANFWITVTIGTVTYNVMSGAFNTTPDYTCTGGSGACPGVSFGITAYQGNTVLRFEEFWTNRMSTPAALAAPVGVMLNDATLMRYAKSYVQGALRFGTFSDGSSADQRRWADCGPPCPGSSWGHTMGWLNSLITVADTIARTGDTSLYTFQSPDGQFGSSGNNLGLIDVMRHWARLANGTLRQYGTTDGSQLNSSTLLTWNNSNGDYYSDFLSMISNIYYQDSEVHQAMTRGILSGVAGCRDPQYGCFGGGYGYYPDLPFMFGNMEGKVSPYLSPVNLPEPTNLHIVSP
jgi:hypothetical protein